MLFNSPAFIFGFLPLVFGGYFLFSSIASPSISRSWLAVCSIFFYGWWNPSYLPILFVSMLINFFLGRFLTTHKKKTVLVIGILFNLSLLGYFKYTDFLISNFNFTFSTHISLLHVALPLAISFFTFQQITFIVDCFKNKVKNYSFMNYALFVTFFPHLVAGPIVHHKIMMPQFQNEHNHKINYENISRGLFIFSIGLFKKVILADQFATTVGSGMGYLDTIDFFDAWALILSYTFQLYFDFSGYSDMAIGLALLFNIKLPINFNSPYKATQFQDLLSRWHITLTHFLYEYVYFPINRFFSRKVIPRWKIRLSSTTQVNLSLMTLFLMSGIWHGAGWNFVIWGLLVGIGIVVYRTWSKCKIRLPTILAWMLTFSYLNLTLVFFKMESFQQALLFFKALFGFQGFTLPFELSGLLSPLASYGFRFVPTPINKDWKYAALIGLGLIIVLGFKNSSEKMAAFKPSILHALFFILILVYALLNLTKISEFLYFKF
ncbi:MBOAT family O-acyltransferase [Paenibacillus sp. KS-LC4]|uniref:MBOAT family O-acyltransferase n=1 Tax=Paenibacillus sp. KS-LC4 TaxID=2979727 RepID=UPI0030D6108B